MPAKLTHKFVEAAFEQRGYQLLEPYVNSFTPVKFRCPKSHEHFMRFSNFRSGASCAICTEKYVSNEAVKSFIEKEGWKLKNEYLGANEPLSIECPSGHLTTQTWHKLKECGLKCKYCAGVNKYTEEEIRAILFKNGDILTSSYKNRRSKISFTCSKGHSHEMQFRAYLDGQRCPHCSGKRRLTPKIVQEYLQSFGCKLISKNVKNNSLLEINCSKGHSYQRTWTHIQKYPQCPYCIGHRITTEEKLIKSRVRSHIKSKLKTLSLGKGKGLYKSKTQLANELSLKIYEEIGNPPSMDGTWTIDHIVPVSRFNLANKEELLACWHPKNLRWLTAKENYERRNRMTLEEVEYMQENHPEIINAASRFVLGEVKS